MAAGGPGMPASRAAKRHPGQFREPGHRSFRGRTRQAFARLTHEATDAGAGCIRARLWAAATGFSAVSHGRRRSSCPCGPRSPCRWGSCTRGGSPPGGVARWHVRTLGPLPSRALGDRWPGRELPDQGNSGRGHPPDHPRIAPRRCPGCVWLRSSAADPFTGEFYACCFYVPTCRRIGSGCGDVGSAGRADGKE